MRSHRLTGAVVLVALTLLLPPTASAQWINYKTPGVPRLPDGKADLSAPTPRTADGKPDLSGIWSGAGPMYRFNIAQDLNTEDIKPWAEALFLQRVRHRVLGPSETPMWRAGSPSPGGSTLITSAPWSASAMVK